MMLAAFTSADASMLVAIFVLLVALMGLALAEMGLSRISRPKAQALADSGSKGGRSLLRLVSNPERFVNPVLLVITLCQMVQAALTGFVAYRLFGVSGVIVGIAVNTLLFFVIAESVPKTWALLHPERAAMLSARPVSALVAFPPLQFASRALIGFTNVLIPGKGIKDGPFVSERELLATVEAAAQDDSIEHEERELIESIIEFGDTVAREIMVPRPDMINVMATASVSAALDIAIEHGFSRVPVVGDGVDDVVGLAYTKDLMGAERSGRGAMSVKELARAAMFVPETKAVSRLMREMQSTKQHMAVLVDEYGGVAGLVTLEDCIEELIGDIVDEYDTEDDEVEHLASGDLRVDASMSVDELSDLLGFQLPDDDWDTVGGFVFGTLGHVPEVGESIEFNGRRFLVEEMEGRRVGSVLVSEIPGWIAPESDDE